jgi:hypothetical protein
LKPAWEADGRLGVAVLAVSPHRCVHQRRLQVARFASALRQPHQRNLMRNAQMIHMGGRHPLAAVVFSAGLLVDSLVE